MAKKACPECGNPLKGNETICPECGNPFSNESNENLQSRQNIIDEGDNDAEAILRKYLNLFKKLLCIVSVVVAVIMVLISIISATQVSGDVAVPTIIITLICAPLFAYIGIAIAKLIWAVGMIFINISTNVRSIKKSLISNK